MSDRPRKYQRDAQRAVEDAWKRGVKRVLLVSPTGSGKTRIARMIVKALPKGTRVLWLAHRKELIAQAADELRGAGLVVGTIVGGKAIDTLSPVLVASVQTYETGRAVPDVDLVVVDEAHRAEAATYKAILAASGARVLGLTATPWRLDGRGLGNTFEEMIVATTPQRLIATGHVAHQVIYGLPEEKAAEIVKGVQRIGGDYAIGALGTRMMRRALMGDVVKEYRRIAPGVPALCFAASRKHGKALAGRFAADGWRVAYVDGKTDALDRDNAIAELDCGDLDVVVNVDVLTEGFDCDRVKCIIMARPTRSLTRFLQYVGRGVRIDRVDKGRRLIVIDHAGNCQRFGEPWADRTWSLSESASRSSGAPLMVRCKCGALVATQSTLCSECGEARPRTKRETEEHAAELERLAASDAYYEQVRAAASAVGERIGAGAEWALSVASYARGRA